LLASEQYCSPASRLGIASQNLRADNQEDFARLGRFLRFAFVAPWPV
jgi:hypothetical protein